VSDRHCVDVASVLYETMYREGMTDVAVSRGLHLAVRALRNEQSERVGKWRGDKAPGSGTRVTELPNFYWAPYVHFGV
jgi:hypothetical protein